MIVGVPKEVKNAEFRVALTPVGVRELVGHGHIVLIESKAGEGSTIHDEEYEAQGATIVDDAAEVFAASEMILKVKEPQPFEVDQLREGQLLFTYLHLAAYPRIASALLSKQITAIAYETVQLPDRSLPLLAPMSEVAGRMAVQAGAYFLEKAHGGRGLLLGGVPGVKPAKVAIVGAGVAGSNAAAMAVGLQANVTILDVDMAKLRALDAIYCGRVTTLASSQLAIEETVIDSDLVIGSVLIPGASAPKLVTEDMVRGMRRGSVLVDIAIDQGGCFETSRETTHKDPVYTVHDVLHYAVGNIPGAVPNTSTYALTNATLRYAVALANLGVEDAAKRYPELVPGVSIVNSSITNSAVAASLGRDLVALNVALAG